MGESLEFGDVTAEIRGVMVPGRIKLADTNIVFKNNKTGKVEHIAADDIELINSQQFIDSWGLRVFTKHGALHRFSGFKESDADKVRNFIKKAYGQEMIEKEMCYRGWNWGTANFKGSVLSFDKDAKTIFEIPLPHVSQCMTGKNEVTLEFHQDDDAPIGLLEMRFHIPSSESQEDDPVARFQSHVMSKASVISASGDAIAIFREVHCLTPRGRYDIKIFLSFFQLHGKTFDYKITMQSVLRLFLLPHKDNRQMFLVLSLDPPIKQGQTRYHFLVLLFQPDEETSVSLPFNQKELREKFEGKIESELSGPVYEVMGKIMKGLIGRKITGPGSFVGHSGTAAISCSFKAAAGYLYPLERGFIYIHKPPIHIRFEEVASVNFARGGGSTRSFDFEVALRNGTVHTFSSIEKEEYSRLFDFIQQKKLHVSNIGKDKGAYKDVDFGDSDDENEPDAYLARLQAEAREKDTDNDGEESTDEDFKPGENESDVAEEFDSNAESESSDDSDASGGSAGSKKLSDTEKMKQSKPKKEKKEHVVKERKERKKKSSKREDAKPKRGTTAFLLWLNEMRDQIKRDNPGIKLTDISKKAGEMWKDLKDKSKWEEMAAKDKQRYLDEMKNYTEKGGDEDSGKKAAKRKVEKSPSKKSSNISGGSGSGYKSKEYISDSESSSSSNPHKSKKANKSSTEKETDKNKNKKKQEIGSDDDDEEEESMTTEDDTNASDDGSN